MAKTTPRTAPAPKTPRAKRGTKSPLLLPEVVREFVQPRILSLLKRHPHVSSPELRRLFEAETTTTVNAKLWSAWLKTLGLNPRRGTIWDGLEDEPAPLPRRLTPPAPARNVGLPPAATETPALPALPAGGVPRVETQIMEMSDEEVALAEQAFGNAAIGSPSTVDDGLRFDNEQ